MFACPTRHALGSLFQPHMWLSGEVSTPQKARSTRRRSRSAEGDNRGASTRNPDPSGKWRALQSIGEATLWTVSRCPDDPGRHRYIFTSLI